MAKRTKVPRASFAVTLLDDDDYVEMVSTSAGCRALGLFLSLVVCAKVQGNGGVFVCKRSLLCRQVKWKSRNFDPAMKYLLDSAAKWVVKNDAGAIVIRSFEKWNSGWGGARDNAGRNSSGNQVDSSGIQVAHLDSVSDSDSDSVSDTNKNNTIGDLDIRENPDRPPSPCERYDSQYESGAQSAWNVIPKKKRSGFRKFEKEFILARRRGNKPEFLTQRLDEYYKSPIGRGERWVAPTRFLEDGMYDDPDDAWQQTRESKPNPKDDADTYLEDLDRRVKETADARRSEREENERQNREYAAKKKREAEA